MIVDDGSGAVIDCVYRHPKLAAPPESEYRASSSILRPNPPPVTFQVGDTVRARGKVTKWHRERQMQLDKIEVCRSANEEPQHTLDVIKLHETKYTKPFMIQTKPPPVPQAAIPPLPLSPIAASSDNALQAKTKSTSSYRPPPVQSSPTKHREDVRFYLYRVVFRN